MALSIFIPSSTGMEAQSHAMGQVSTNIANISTVGYKTNETMFYTLLGSNPVVKGNQADLSSSRTDIHGVGYYDRTNILDPGVISNTGVDFDVAIDNNNNAFFMVKDAYSNEYFTRAGNFSTRSENGVTYLVSQNGMKVQGFPSLDGKDSFGSAPEDIVIKYPDKVPPLPTTEATITANVPALGVDKSTYGITVYAPSHDGETLNMTFTKVVGKNNTWTLSFDVEDGTAVGSETEVQFSDKGELISPKNLTVDIAWNDGDTNNIALDISNMTQFDAGSGVTNVKQDGAPGGNFVKSTIDANGVVKATYSNGDTYNFAKLALVGFAAPNNLTPIEGTMFQANSETGESFYTDTTKVVPQALEGSATEITEEFGTLITVQRAYSVNSNAFTTANEMLQLLVDLKT